MKKDDLIKFKMFPERVKELTGVYADLYVFTFDQLNELFASQSSSLPPQPRQFKKFSLLEETETVTSSDTIIHLQPGRGAEGLSKVMDYLEGKVVSGMELSEALEISECLSILNEYRTQSEGKDMYPKCEQKLFAFKYNPMTEESGAVTMSLHRTRKGAEMAMEFDKEKRRKEWIELWKTEEEQKDFPFGQFEAWFIDEINISE